MSHHLTSLFKSAAGIANDVLGNSGKGKGKRNRDRDRDGYLPQGKKGEKGEDEQRENLQTEYLGSSLGGASIGDEGEIDIVGRDCVGGEFEDVVEGGEVGGIGFGVGMGRGEIDGISGRCGRCGRRRNCNLVDMSSSAAATNLSEKLCPTTCLRAGDGSDLDGLDVEVSPTDGLGEFDGKVGEGGCGCECGSVDEADGDGDEHGSGRHGVQNTEASGLKTRRKKHKGKDITPATIPLPISSTNSSTNTITTFELEETKTRNRAFTIPRRPIVTHRRECLYWKTDYEGLKYGEKGEGQKQGKKGKGFKNVGSVKSEVISERKNERSKRSERERVERGRRDLRHENPLYSHPIHPTTISQGTPPITNPLYTNPSSPSKNSSNSKSRAFRHSYTIPIHGFNSASKGVEGLTEMESMAGGTCIEGIAGVGNGSTIGKGTARDRYSGNSNTTVSGSGSAGMGIGMGIGSRRGSFLRRASVSFKAGVGMGMGMGIGYMRSSSGGVEGMHTQGWGVHAEKVDSNSNTIPAEFLRGVGGYAGDGMGMGIGMGGDKIDIDAEKRRGDRQSLILPKFEWEEEFVGGNVNTRKEV